MVLSRRELLTSGVMSGAAFGRAEDALPATEDEREINQTLKNLLTEFQRPAHSELPGEMSPVSRLREQMIEFMRGTNKWPDFIDVGYTPWFAIYDWHVRFAVQPTVVRLADGHYGLTFMFTTLVLRQEQTPSYIGLPYDKER